jgi:hypothetical protein
MKEHMSITIATPAADGIVTTRATFRGNFPREDTYGDR